MRKNLFLHFLNRDSREIFGLYDFHTGSEQIAFLKRSLNAAVLLCEDYCVIPPGFAIEDEIAFELSEVNRAFFAERRILLPMREANLTEYADKKRSEYSPQRDRYSGLFSDRRIEFLGANATGLIPRRTRIGDEIVAGWSAAPDSKGLWRATKSLIEPDVVEIVRAVPTLIADDGIAVTWSEILKRLPDAAGPALPDLRHSLQHIYFRLYCEEFKLTAICDLPFARDDFGLAKERKIYSFARLKSFLEAFELAKILLQCSADTLCALKSKAGAIAFIDAYSGLAQRYSSQADLTFATTRARRATTFDWVGFRARHTLLLAEPDGLALTELDDALSEAADALTSQNDLRTRLDDAVSRSIKKPTRRIRVESVPEILLYVALEEELKILVEHFSLDRPVGTPAAIGQIGDMSVAVLSPRAMGRVPAAVEVARYLEARKAAKPRLVIIVGLAGGFEEGATKPGHIICGTTVVDLASRKVQDEGDQVAKAKFRRRDYNLDNCLQQVLQSSVFEMEDWRTASIKNGRWPEDRRPSIHYGPIASVDEVVASNDWREKLLSSADKMLGVEMEAGGVCAAAQPYRVPVAMLRAVSDSADPVKTDDNWRTRGMITVATLLQFLPFHEVLKAL